MMEGYQAVVAAVSAQAIADAGARRLGSTALGWEAHAHGVLWPVVHCFHADTRISLQPVCYIAC